MLRLHLDTAVIDLRRSSRIFNYVMNILTVIVGITCLAAFVFTAVYWNINTKIEDKCQKLDEKMVLCFIRSIFADAFENHWEKYIMVSLLFTYANVYFHMIIECSRTNVSGLLNQMSLLTILVIVGIGVCFPLLFIPAFIYFYKSQNAIEKSPVTINTVCLALIYTILFICVPTYLYYFLSTSGYVISSILAIVLLASPIGFSLLSVPFRLCAGWMRHCWIISSHRLIVYCHIILFILHSPLFFISLVALFYHCSFDEIKTSYINQTSDVNPIVMIWSIDYISLLISLILFIISNEYLLYQ